MILGMKKGRISRIFVGETLCVGAISLVTGLLLGFVFSQGISIIALKLFAISLPAIRIEKPLFIRYNKKCGDRLLPS